MLLQFSLFIGEPEAVKHIRTVHHSVFYAILLFLAVTLIPWLFNDSAYGMVAVSGIQWLLFACLIFAVFTYVRLLRSLRANISRMYRMWQFGSEELAGK